MDTPSWEQRFRAPVSYLPEWSPAAPGRVVYASNESGRWQIHTLDLERGTTRQVTNDPVGLTDVVPTLDGEGVLWFQDETGDESGRWLVQPFHGGDTEPFLVGVPHGWSDGLAQAPGIVVAAISDRDGFAVHVSLDGCAGHGARALVRLDRPRRSRRRRVPARRVCRRTARLLCLEHAEHGDLLHPALRVVDPRTGERLGELLDDGMSLGARVLVTGLRRPAPRVQARARRRRAPRTLGSRHRRADESRDRAGRRGHGRRLVPRRVGAPAGERLRGPEPPVPLRARAGRALPDRDRARLHREGAGATGRTRLAAPRAGSKAAARSRRHREPKSSRSATRHPSRAPTSRGTSSTSTASRYTASS